MRPLSDSTDIQHDAPKLRERAEAEGYAVAPESTKGAIMPRGVSPATKVVVFQCP